MNNGKMYVLVRRDLSPGYQATQAMHAALDFSVQYPEVVRDWNGRSNVLVVLSVKDEAELHRYADMAESWRIRWTLFREPDLDNHATALALQPSPVTATFTKNLPLALKEYR